MAWQRKSFQSPNVARASRPHAEPDTVSKEGGGGRDARAPVARGWHARGYIPHGDFPGLIQSIGFRLFDSVPAEVVERFERELELVDSVARRKELTMRIEKYADAGFGSSWLSNPLIADLVENALLHFDQQRYDLLAWCVMPNHVHVLVATRLGFSLREILHSWKSFASHRANKILQRDGEFWFADYFDRFMRSTDDMISTIEYIEWNPVNAKLVEAPGQWNWSSASERHRDRVIGNRLLYRDIDPKNLPDF